MYSKVVTRGKQVKHLVTSPGFLRLEVFLSVLVTKL